MSDGQESVVGSDSQSPGARDLEIQDGALDAMAESLFADVPDEDAVTDSDQTDDDAGTATEEEATEDATDGNEESDDSESEVEGEESDVDGEGGDDDGENFYTEDELDSIAPEQLDPERIPPGARKWFERWKEKSKAADEKFRLAAEQRKDAEQQRRVLDELKRSIDEQTRLKQQEFDYNRQQREREERERKYQQIAETYGQDRADMQRQIDDAMLRNQPQQPLAENPELKELKRRLEAAEQKEAERQIGEAVYRAMDAAGLDRGDENAFLDVHREALAKWQLEKEAGANRPQDFTPIEDIAQSVRKRYDSRMSDEAVLKKVKENAKLREQLKKEILAEIRADAEKKKKTKTVVSGGGSGEIRPKAESEITPTKISDPSEIITDEILSEILGAK